MVYTKKQKFAIEVDEFGRSKKHLIKLLKVLQQEYPFLTQASRIITSKRVSNARKGDIIIFGSSNKYDFKLVSAAQAVNSYGSYQLLSLAEDWTKVKKKLGKFAEANYPEEFFIEDEYLCCVPDIVYVDNDRDWEDIFVLTPSTMRKNKKARRPKRTSNLVLDNMKVYHNFVKIGWDVYDIYLNEDEDEYFQVNGNTYWIDRDSSGNGKVSVA